MAESANTKLEGHGGAKVQTPVTSKQYVATIDLITPPPSPVPASLALTNEFDLSSVISEQSADLPDECPTATCTRNPTTQEVHNTSHCDAHFGVKANADADSSR